MKRLIQILLPVAFIAVGVLLFRYFIATAPEPRQRPSINTTPEVVARSLEKEDYDIVLDSQGTVQARTTSTLIPEVRGRITDVAANFREGAFFEEGDILLEIDDSDYQTELIVAEASLAQAELREFEETARYEQAKLDWERLNPGQEANPLTLREPQIKQARASAASARARLENARRNLERTKIRAPFAGRILSKSVDVGQYISPGNQLARIYAVDFAEVRLPLTATQFSFLDMPSVYRGENPALREGPVVTLSAKVGDTFHEYRGRIVRAEGSVDTRSRQIFVVAQIRNPYGRTVEGRPPLKVGSFVQAKIQGKTMEDVYVVPRVLLRENAYLLMITPDNYLQRETVGIIWETDDVIVINEGLKEGEKLCLTEVPFALEGWPVNVVDESGTEVEAVVDEATPARARPPRPTGGGGIGDRIDSMIAAIDGSGKALPDDLRQKLIGLKETSDFSQMRTVIGEVREWAEANGVEMPAGGRGGGGGGARNF